MKKKRISRILGVGLTLALLSSLLIGALPVLGLSAPSVSIAPTQNVISQPNAPYTVTFAIGAELVVGDTITITFPSDTVVSGVGGASISVSPGWIGNVPGPPTWGGSAGAGGWTFSGTSRTVTYTLVAPDNIGTTANVIITLPSGITNPSTPGDYTLTVKTSKETTPQTSNVYTIVPPSLYYPGTVEVYNPSGYLMGVSSYINTALGSCTGPGFTIKVSTGYYDETITINEQVTIEAMHGATPVIADLPDVAGVPTTSGLVTVLNGGDKTAGQTGVILDGLTFMGNAAGASVLDIQAEGVTVQDCTFTKFGTVGNPTIPQHMIDFSAASPTYPSTITGCDFDLTMGSVADVGVNVAATGNNLTISGCTFVGDANPAYTQDYYIQNAGGTTAPIISTGNTATGTYAGTFIYTTAGTMISTNDTMSGLWRAIRAYGGSLTMTGTSISGCGIPATSYPPIGIPAVDIFGGTTVFTMTNSTVSNSLAYAFNLLPGVDWDNVNVMFNKITTNAKNVYSAATAVGGGTAPFGANFTHNWWGDPAGPASGSIGHATDATTEPVDTRWPLGAPGSGDIVFGQSSYTSTKTGTKIGITETTAGLWWDSSGLPSTAGQVGSALYESNPAPIDPPYPVLDGGYLDIFVGAPGDPTDLATVQIPNANVGATTAVMIWNNLTGEWDMADQQGVNIYAGTVWFLAGPGIWPEIGDLGGTAVALVAAPEAPLGMPTGLSPALGAYDVEIDPSFTWDAVAGADSYEFQIAEETDVPGVDPYSIPFDVKIVEINGCRLIDDLKYETTYVWRVMAIRGTDESAWTNSFLTTMAEPEEPPPPIEVIETPPPVINIPDWPDTIVQEQTPVIPDYLLWVVVGVGAVLVIAVIVLIVRTRRVA